MSWMFESSQELRVLRIVAAKTVPWADVFCCHTALGTRFQRQKWCRGQRNEVRCSWGILSPLPAWYSEHWVLFHEFHESSTSLWLLLSNCSLSYLMQLTAQEHPCCPQNEASRSGKQVPSFRKWIVPVTRSLVKNPVIYSVLAPISTCKKTGASQLSLLQESFARN